ncbi:MAG: Sec-independent protein translocase protein TatB [Gammaproteobacteria bacterium]
MFDVGFWELVILFGLGLMVLGPERLPKVATKVGRWAGQARRMARNLTDQMRDEIEPIESSMRSMDDAMRKDYSAMRPDVGETAKADHVDDVAQGSTDAATAEPAGNTAAAEPDSAADHNKPA